MYVTNNKEPWTLHATLFNEKLLIRYDMVRVDLMAVLTLCFTGSKLTQNSLLFYALWSWILFSIICPVNCECLTCVPSAHVHVTHLSPGISGRIIDLHTFPHQRTVMSPCSIQLSTEHSDTCTNTITAQPWIHGDRRSADSHHVQRGTNQLHCV